MSGRPLRGRASGLPHDGCVGVPVQQMGEVGLLQHLSALVDHPTAAGRGRRGGECGEGETQEGGEGEREGGGDVGVVGEDGGVGGAGSGRGG